jgi:hypothetical protein
MFFPQIATTNESSYRACLKLTCRIVQLVPYARTAPLLLVIKRMRIFKRFLFPSFIGVYLQAAFPRLLYIGLRECYCRLKVYRKNKDSICSIYDVANQNTCTVR